MPESLFYEFMTDGLGHEPDTPLVMLFSLSESQGDFRHEVISPYDHVTRNKILTCFLTLVSIGLLDSLLIVTHAQVQPDTVLLVRIVCYAIDLYLLLALEGIF